jgi:hypothetical protein
MGIFERWRGDRTLESQGGNVVIARNTRG